MKNKILNLRPGNGIIADGRLFVGVRVTGLSYCDRTRERDGDYVRLAFLPFDTLVLEFTKDCPESLRAEITTDAQRVQSKAGQQYQVSISRQTVTLGSKVRDVRLLLERKA